jgi:endonuclease-3 related protein
MEMYRAARERFGHQGWWPAAGGGTLAERTLEICVGAVLTQNTSWANVEKALANLAAAGAMSVGRLHAMPHQQLAELIRPAGYFNVKSKRLKNFIARVHEGFGEDIEAFLGRSVATLREELLAINGIGRETADSIILYAAGKCTFVVDAYTCRVLLRHYLIDAESDYEMVKDFLESSLPEDVELYNDFHAQFVAVGKKYCRPTARCPGCPLEHLPHDPLAGAREC